MAVPNLISSANFFKLGAITMLLVPALQIAASADPTSQPIHTSVPSAALTDSPSGAMHAYLQALDTGDSKRSLACWNTVDPQEYKMAGLQVDMMLAVSKLKKAVRAKWGDVAPFDLQMAVVGEDECGVVKEDMNGETCTVDVASIDDKQPHNSYSMVKIAGHWELSVADQLKNRPAKSPPDAEVAAGKEMIKIINSTADKVINGQLQNTEDVKRNISESMSGP